MDNSEFLYAIAFAYLIGTRKHPVTLGYEIQFAKWEMTIIGIPITFYFNPRAWNPKIFHYLFSNIIDLQLISIRCFTYRCITLDPSAIYFSFNAFAFFIFVEITIQPLPDSRET
jgi:hypothetical protein